MNLVEYVLKHTERGECNCGQCFDRGSAPDPSGHVADLVFFKVAACGSPTLEEFRALTKAHKGEFCEVDPFDGNDHSYIELGGWIGNQGVAMQFMGLGALLGAFKLLSPEKLKIHGEMAVKMAERGFLSIHAS